MSSKIVNNSIGWYQKEKKHDDGLNVEILVEAIYTSKFRGFVISIPTAQFVATNTSNTLVKNSIIDRVHLGNTPRDTHYHALIWNKK